jgi:phospholipid/cholesterol/gamma-HCH transport system substrate-binding protein
MAKLTDKVDGITRILAVVAVVAVVVALVIVALPGQDKKYLTASFPRTVSLYEGSDVRILGVPVGKVESVTPAGTDVVVKMWYDAKYDVPSDAQAVIISPSIVGDRFVQLTPVYKKGERALPSHAVLTTKSTSTPLELDQIYQSIDNLSVALGPQGANRQGSLTRLLDSTAANFEGEGAQFHQTIKDVSRFTGTLDDNKEELFGTARELERFVSALAKNDTTVRRFNDSLTSASDLLDDERNDLAAALRNLGVAMEAVQGFVEQNRSTLSHNIKGLDQVSKVLVKQRAALDEVLTVAPTTLANLFHTYNPAAGTLDTRTNLGETINGLTADPVKILCGIVAQSNVDKAGASKVCDALKTLPVPKARSAALNGPTSVTSTREVEHVDRSLGGILEVRR